MEGEEEAALQGAESVPMRLSVAVRRESQMLRCGHSRPSSSRLRRAQDLEAGRAGTGVLLLEVTTCCIGAGLTMKTWRRSFWIPDRALGEEGLAFGAVRRLVRAFVFQREAGEIAGEVY